MTHECLDGLDIHLLNERAQPLHVQLESPVEKLVAHASNAEFKADATYETHAGEVHAINAVSATFYG
jgi:hypothetical protein